MDYLSLIKKPIEAELSDFIELFNSSLEHEDGLLGHALNHIRKRGGKRMRPMLVLLMAKNFGQITRVTQEAALGLELLHTASLIHDDVVDESDERRGQASVNAYYDNKVAVLVGDYVLSTSLLHVALTQNSDIVEILARLGQTLSDGEILQLTNTKANNFDEKVYFDIIGRKTAALFEACAHIGALSVGASGEALEAACTFGRNIGIIFQIRDDIFDYYDEAAIGKPTGLDMAEGKLTLPVLHALHTAGDERMKSLAAKVKEGGVTADEIAELVDFTKRSGGIEYAVEYMEQIRRKSLAFIDRYVTDEGIRTSLLSYLDYVIQRDK